MHAVYDDRSSGVFYEKIRKSTDKLAKIVPKSGYPHEVLSKNEGETIDINKFRYLGRNLLFCIVKVGPDCENAGRDLAWQISNPCEEDWKAMGRMAGYLKGKTVHGRLIKKSENLMVLDYTNTIYAVKFVSGMVCTIGGMVLSQTFPTYKITTLSSTEAECIA